MVRTAPRRSLPLILLAFGALMSGVTAAGASPITYTFVSYPSLQAGYTLSGTMTTDGNTGPLAATDITNWTYSITNGSTTDSESGTSEAAWNDVTASATELVINVDLPAEIGLDGTGSSGLVFGNTFSLGGPGVYEALLPSGAVAWQDVPLSDTALGGDPWVVAQAVPEPGTVTLVLLGPTLLLLGNCRARRAIRF